MKDLLSNVGSGGGAASAPAAGGAAAGGGAAEEAKEEAKEEGEFSSSDGPLQDRWLTLCPHYREGGVRRRHGIRSLRLSDFLRTSFLFVLPELAWICDGISRPKGWRLLISGVQVHRRSLLGNLKMRF